MEKQYPTGAIIITDRKVPISSIDICLSSDFRGREIVKDLGVISSKVESLPLTVGENCSDKIIEEITRGLYVSNSHNLIGRLRQDELLIGVREIHPQYEICSQNLSLYRYLDKNLIYKGNFLTINESLFHSSLFGKSIDVRSYGTPNDGPWGGIFFA